MEHRAILTPYPSAAEGKATTQMGVLILNADDWGRDEETTGRILDCLLCGALSSTSAMVYMEDSERAAAIARDRNLDAGLHLNFTTPLTAPGCPERLVNHHQRVSRFLSRNRLAQAVYHPGLAGSFEYLVKRQLEEFARLYGAEPERIDGHHHMHLCANVLLASLLPAGTIVRRSFSFSPGEKSWGNRLYRRGIDRILARRHRVGDFFFSLPPLEPASRLAGIFSAARQSVVEVETHPVCPAEYRFLTGGELFRWTEDLPIATRYAVRGRFPLSE
jgi:hypothetical protein